MQALSTIGLPMRVSIAALQPRQTMPKGSSQRPRQFHRRSGNGLNGMMSQLKLVLGSDEKTNSHVTAKPITVCTTSKRTDSGLCSQKQLTIARTRRMQASIIGVTGLS